MTPPGFGPMLDECTTKLGSYEEAPPSDAGTGVVTVHYPDGSTDHDAVGFMQEAGTTVCYGFDWVSQDPERIRELAREEGIGEEQIEREIELIGEEPFVLLTAAYPWQNIRIEFAQDLGGIFK